MSSPLTPMLIAIYVILARVLSGQGFKNGAPETICINHVPHHNHLPQQYSPSPYAIQVTPSTYRPGDILTVRLFSPLGEKFIGYQVRAQQVGGNIEQFIGAFLEAPDNTKLQAWYPDQLHERNCFTHTTNDKRSELSVTWRAPNVSVGDIVFRGTLMKDFETFWVNVTSNVLTADDPKQVHYEPNVVRTSVRSKDFVKDCGASKGCMLYPKGCSSKECKQVVAFQANVTSKMIRFELYTANSPAYISIGFSHDLKMGDDSTVTCVQVDDFSEVHYGYSPAYYSERHKLHPARLQEAAVERDGSALYCNFLRSFQDSVLKYDHVTHEPYHVHFDFSKPYYLQLAWGGTYERTAIPWKHTELPVNSIEKIDLLKTKIAYATAMPDEYKVHSSFGVIGWILFASAGMLFARHFKPDMAKTVGTGFCSRPIWFHLHFWSALGCVAVAMTGVAVMFVYRRGWTKSAQTHAVIGLVTASLGVLNVCAGLLRPAPDSKLRPLFLWAHRIASVTAFVLAWVTVFLGANAETMARAVQWQLTLILAVWLLCLGLFEVGFEVFSCIDCRKDVYRVDETGDHSRTHPVKWVMLTAFLIISTALLVAFIYVIIAA